MDEAADFLHATGFRKPIKNLTLSDKHILETSLVDFHCFIKVKGEMDQFMDGLSTLGILDIIKNSPEVIKEMFVHPSTDLTAGIHDITV